MSCLAFFVSSKFMFRLQSLSFSDWVLLVPWNNKTIAHVTTKELLRQASCRRVHHALGDPPKPFVRKCFSWAHAGVVVTWHVMPAARWEDSGPAHGGRGKIELCVDILLYFSVLVCFVCVAVSCHGY